MGWGGKGGGGPYYIRRLLVRLLSAHITPANDNVEPCKYLLRPRKSYLSGHGPLDIGHRGMTIDTLYCTPSPGRRVVLSISGNYRPLRLPKKYAVWRASYGKNPDIPFLSHTNRWHPFRILPGAALFIYSIYVVNARLVELVVGVEGGPISTMFTARFRYRRFRHPAKTAQKRRNFRRLGARRRQRSSKRPRRRQTRAVANFRDIVMSTTF